MEQQDFDEYLFSVNFDVDDELNEFTWTEGEAQVARWLVQILSTWRERATSLSHKDQNTVLWRIGSNPLYLGWMLKSDSAIGFEQQCEIVRAARCVTEAIPSLFDQDEPMENGYYMWWDLLIEEVDSLELGAVALEILSELSLHPDDRVQLSALHGLGHLQHPGRAAAVDLYTQFHPDSASNAWIRQCRDGSVM